MSTKQTDIEIARQLATNIAMASKRPSFDRQFFISTLFRRLALTIKDLNSDSLTSHVGFALTVSGETLNSELFRMDSFFISSYRHEASGVNAVTNHPWEHSPAINVHVDPIPLTGIVGRARALANRALFEIFGLEWLLEREWRRAISDVLLADSRLRAQHGLDTPPKLRALIDAAEISLSSSSSACSKSKASRL